VRAKCCPNVGRKTTHNLPWVKNTELSAGRNWRRFFYGSLAETDKDLLGQSEALALSGLESLQKFWTGTPGPSCDYGIIKAGDFRTGCAVVSWHPLSST